MGSDVVISIWMLDAAASGVTSIWVLGVADDGVTDI